MTIRAIGALLCALGFLFASFGPATDARAEWVWTKGDKFWVEGSTANPGRKDTLGSRVAARDTTKSKKKKAGIVINLPWAKGDQSKRKRGEKSVRQ
jgi:hypothetical protein